MGTDRHRVDPRNQTPLATIRRRPGLALVVTASVAGGVTVFVLILVILPEVTGGGAILLMLGLAVAAGTGITLLLWRMAKRLPPAAPRPGMAATQFFIRRSQLYAIANCVVGAIAFVFAALLLPPAWAIGIGILWVLGLVDTWFRWRRLKRLPRPE